MTRRSVTAPSEAPLWTKKQIADRYRVTPRTVETWIARGYLPPPIKLGTQQQSRVRFTPDSVDELDQRLRACSAA